MFCIVAFVILSILGIFSATNRSLAKEALDCVLRRVTLRPCNTGFDEKMKARILGSVITRSENAARLINSHFELLSWTFFILMFASSIYAVRSSYLFYVTGSCNGLNQTAFCVLDPQGSSNQISGIDETCKVKPTTAADLTLSGVNLTDFPIMNSNSKDTIVMIGSYGCDYTRKAYPLVRELVDKSKASFIYLDYPVKEKTDYLSRVGFCVAKQDPGKYWQFNDTLFAADKAKLEDVSFIEETLTGLGMDSKAIGFCASDPQTQATVTQQLDQILKTNFYGTPTVFINGDPLIGPKPYRVYAIKLRGLWYW
ncbi:MAG: thioredoxin domain-containing protein [Chloroflexi bacterium]|nr:thioredoxin domain-containing protein [Chloroflexota bacterium]